MSHFAVLLFFTIIGGLFICFKTKRIKPLFIFVFIILGILILPFILFLLADFFGADFKD